MADAEYRLAAGKWLMAKRQPQKYCFWRKCGAAQNLQGLRTLQAAMGRFVADLHAHTTFSDGVYSPMELADHMAAAGLKGFAVTDHDTVAGLSAAADAARTRDLEFIPGIEMSTQLDGIEMHLLGYYINVADPAMVRYTTDVPQKRYDRAEAIVSRLNDLGVPIEMGEVELVAGEGSIGRPHIASVLHQSGQVSSMAEAFGRYIRDGAPAFVPTVKMGTVEAIELIHGAGGVAVLAHPGHWTRHSTLLTLIRAGLDGIEVRHPSHKAWLSSYYRKLVNDFVLVATGGSDFHGHRAGEDRHLGRFGVFADELSALKAVHENRQKSVA